ncbi:hypothetical protein [uncultured Mycolicibacterium sp.]|uniref:hypothetical protein n=1 Tax=uncultured Mycolicibacterium sp. TaxID=2320817 RepID=UPI002638D235|nr:hypothetical protein [uncultured Mycolicibacterium sp.]
MRIAATLAAAAALVAVPGCEAQAQPAEPRADAACATELAGALTRVDDTVLRCHDGHWQPDTDPYPVSDKWLTSDAGLTLHGQGRRNPEMLAGQWIGWPQQADDRCSAEQVVVVAAGELSEPQAAEAERGRPLELAVAPTMFSTLLRGDCLWLRVG